MRLSKKRIQETLDENKDNIRQFIKDIEDMHFTVQVARQTGGTCFISNLIAKALIFKHKYNIPENEMGYWIDPNNYHPVD